MSRTPTVTHKTILDASIALIREQGHERLNARALAARIGCSTQPILYCFKSMDELRRAAYEAADQLHTAFLMEGLDSPNPLLGLGLKYVRFAYEEPLLFRFLFQSNELGQHDMVGLIENPALIPLLTQVAEEGSLDEATARRTFLTIFATAHGFASLLANNALEYDEELVASSLLGSFMGASQFEREINDEIAR
ncbi:MAG: TetR/AcrR family transcriptional regulator [Eggerthellaceae bacterium]|nr:TetR/AcrR family transcriptional regulator [Eggerthellaceae bacterium]